MFYCCYIVNKLSKWTVSVTSEMDESLGPLSLGEKFLMFK